MADSVPGVRLTRRQRLILAENEKSDAFPSNVEVSKISLTGRLDQERLAKAWSRVVARFDCLRARLVDAGAEPRLMFDTEDPAFTFHETAASDLDGLIADACGRPYEFGECLCRPLHVRCPDQDHIIIGQSHLVSDGLTKSLIFQYLSEYYISQGDGDFASDDFQNVLQGKTVNLEEERASEKFWSSCLKAPAPELRLYGEAPRPKRGRLEVESVALDARAVDALKAHRFPALAMTAVAGAVLHRVTGEEAIAIGVPFANRPKGTSETGGLFMEIVPERLNVSSSKSFNDLVTELRSNAKAARKHREYAVSGSKSGHECMFNYRPNIVDSFAALPVKQSFLTGPHYWDTETSIDAPRGAVGVQFEVLRDAQGVPFKLSVHVDVARWPQSGLGAKLLKHFLVMLDVFVSEPETAIGAIDLVDASDVDAVTLGRVTPDDFFADIKDVFSQVRDISEKHPDREAVKFGEATLSYSQLVERAERIAGSLTARGVGAGDVVAVCLHRSEMLPAVLLAIVCTGAAYLPLDPDHATNRLSMILEDAKPSLVVSASDSSDVLKGLPVQTVGINALLDGFDESAVQVSRARLDAIAYVIFTSGSTGRPKGVQVTHRNLATFLRAMSFEPGISKHDRLLAVTTTAFDISALELFGPLANGGTVVIASEKDARDPRKLMRLMANEQISILQATPTTWQMLVEADWRDPAMKVLCGGEALLTSLASELCERGGEIWNMYGPTETTIWSMISRVTPEEGVNLGQPILGTRVSLRTNEGALVPEGVLGEINIEGCGVSAGYFGRPDLTDERFVGENSARRYRTGDLAVHQATPEGHETDKTLHYLGRVDHQVKIRGYRIELGEIETHMSIVRGVSAAAVVPVEGAGGAHALAGFWTGNASAETRDALVGQLKDNLPAYMQPKTLTHLDQFPLNTSGKIDRGSLPSAIEETEQSALTPENNLMLNGEAEQAIAAVYRKASGGPVEDPTVSLFDLGADSLSAIEARLSLEAQGFTLPDNWEWMSVADVARSRIDPVVESAASKWFFNTSRLDTFIVFRSLAIALVVAHHSGWELGLGASLVLFAIAGFSFGRISLPAILKDGQTGRIWSLIAKLLVPLIPASIILFLVHSFIGNSPHSAALFFYENVSHFIDELRFGTQSGQSHITWLWFLHAYLQIFCFLGVLLGVPRVRQIWSSNPWRGVLVFVVASEIVHSSMILFFAGPFGLGDLVHVSALLHFSPFAMLVFFGLGALFALADTLGRRCVAISLGVVHVLLLQIFYLGVGDIFWLLALIICVTFPFVSLPSLIANFLVIISSHALMIYLSHRATSFALEHATQNLLPTILEIAIQLAIGVLLGIALGPLFDRIGLNRLSSLRISFARG